jgi:hypothetical protein
MLGRENLERRGRFVEAQVLQAELELGLDLLSHFWRVDWCACSTTIDETAIGVMRWGWKMR